MQDLSDAIYDLFSEIWQPLKEFTRRYYWPMFYTACAGMLALVVLVVLEWWS